MLCLAPTVIEGKPTASPYAKNPANQFKNEDLYVTFATGMKKEGESLDWHPTLEDAWDNFSDSVAKYVGISKRVIIRKWPEISAKGLQSPIYSIRARLIADDGEKELAV